MSTSGVETGARGLDGSIAETTLSPSDLSWLTKDSASFDLLPNFMALFGPDGFIIDWRDSWEWNK